MDLKVKRIPSADPRLGRHVVHDPRARRFPVRRVVDTSTWRTKTIRTYDPTPNPDQDHGNCTGCDSCMGLNSAGSRRKGVILTMSDADEIYSLATTLDPWAGSWTAPTWEDTGSSGTAAAKAAQILGHGGEYRWHFGGADDVVQTIMTGGADGKGRTVGCGTVWKGGMFHPNSKGVIEPTGSVVGGHQYRARGYDEYRDLVKIRCWWGAGFRDVLIKREHLNDLLMDDGDAYEQDRA